MALKNGAGWSQVEEWYHTHVRPILEKTDPPPFLDELEKLRSQTDALLKGKKSFFPICLIGQAGVGKSTLINTLIADDAIVVPSGGGTGPLTANALRVVYGDTPSFVVKYHAKQQINETRFILEAELLRRAKQDASSAQPVAGEDAALALIELDSEEQKKTRTEDAIGRARLLVAGSQSAQRDIPYLVDALRWVLGAEPIYQTQLIPEDLEVRLPRVKEALHHATSPTAKHFDSADNHTFHQDLRNHACGFLAPLIQEMTIHWPSPVLQSALELVDLPGIGILSDAYASVTSDYLRNHAKAVMLVADARGIRREDAELLQNSGFLNRLLHAGNDLSADPVALIVAAVKIDDVAEENWRNDRAVNGTALRTKAQHFDEQVAHCKADIAHHLNEYLREVWHEDSDAKKHVIQSLLDTLQVFPVSAPQYRMHISKDPDEAKSFLPDVASTNIPALREALALVARSCVEEQDRRCAETQQRFFGQLRARLEVLSAQRNEDDQADGEIKQFSELLNQFMAPLRREFDGRRGGFRNFLRKTVPSEIEGKLSAASTNASEKIGYYLQYLQGAHWSTLRAAVRRQGTFYGKRHINLPHDFALKFEEPVAEVWSREILVDIRRETREFADYQSAVVNTILDWARNQKMRVSTRLLEALVNDVDQNRQKVNAVGKEAVKELQDKVREELIKKIEGPIRNKCQRFVNSQKDVGIGVKDRIIGLFKELARDVVKAATEPATALLVERFREVEKEILQAFGEQTDPLSKAADDLVQRREKSIAREDAKLDRAIEQALAAMPTTQEQAA